VKIENSTACIRHRHIICETAVRSDYTSDNFNNFLKFPLEFCLILVELELQTFNPFSHDLLSLLMLSHVIIHSFLHGSLWFPQPLQHVRVVFHLAYETNDELLVNFLTH
jgi:hypothetical protein